MKIATMDIETDPFLYGKTPLPFAIGYFDGDHYQQFWGDHCVADMMEYLDSIDEPVCIYMHNGGGFDFWYLQDYITNPLFFIKTRIAKCGLLGKHELRDSYRMIPVPLAEYQKDEIDYQKFWYPAREKHKKEICHYLQMDCEYLYQLVQDFIARYGNHLTIGSAAIKQLKSLHPQRHESALFDERFRPYYMGGRNECFKHGEIKAPLKIFDVNSMYPHVMRSYRHPLGSSYLSTKRLPDNKFYFADITAESDGALPMPYKGLSFPHGINRFNACSHEINMGLELGILRIIKVHSCQYFNQTQDFSEFVEKFNTLKIIADKEGDKGGRLFAKLLLNSSYGKFGQNPDNFTDCELFDSINDVKSAGYEIRQVMGERYIGAKKSDIRKWSYNNVAIAASITSAARAELMRGISKSVNAVYCDTDSIICEHLNMPQDDSRLGAWKIEGECDTIYIGGKKLYACYNGNKPLTIKGKEKKACKGFNASADVIRDIAKGMPYVARIDAPLLKMGEDAKFIERNIRATY